MWCDSVIVSWAVWMLFVVCWFSIISYSKTTCKLDKNSRIAKRDLYWKFLLLYRSRWMQETFIELKWIAIFWINRYNSYYMGCLSFVSLLLFLSKHQIKRHSRYACYVKMYGVFAVWLSLYIDHWVCNWWQLQMYGVSSSACFLIYFLIYTPK